MGVKGASQNAGRAPKVRPLYLNTNYEVHVAKPPGSEMVCYGVQNRRTGVFEAYGMQLAFVMKLADDYDRNLRFGLDRPEPETELPMFTRPPTKGGPTSGTMQ